MPITVISGPTIAAGASLSSALDCTAGVPACVLMPADWTDAHLTFQVSPDNAVYFDLFSNSGAEIKANVVAGGTAILLEGDWLRGILYVKFRSGTRDDPIEQTEQRNFTVIVERA